MNLLNKLLNLIVKINNFIYLNLNINTCTIYFKNETKLKWLVQNLIKLKSLSNHM